MKIHLIVVIIQNMDRQVELLIIVLNYIAKEEDQDLLLEH